MFQTIQIPFGPGSGRSSHLPERLDDYTIEMAPGIRPEDVLLMSGEAAYSYSASIGSWVTWSWQVRLIGSSDVLTLGPFRREAFEDEASIQPGDLPLSIRFADGTVWARDHILAQLISASHASATVLGTDGDDHFVGDGRAHTFRGGLGNDTFVASAADELFIGATERTRNAGVAEHNQYSFSGGWGRDTIIGNWIADEVVMGAGLTLENMHVRRFKSNQDTGDDGNYVLSWGDDSVMLQNLPNAADLAESSGRIRFADGRAVSFAELRARLLPADAEVATVDALVGTEGDDVHVLSIGQGNDVITQFRNSAEKGQNDVIALTTDDVTFSVVRPQSFGRGGVAPVISRSLGIRFNRSGEQILVHDLEFANEWDMNGFSVEDFWHSDQVVVRMPDGTTLTGKEVAALAEQTAEDANYARSFTNVNPGPPPTTDQHLVGTWLDERLSGGSGNDTIEAGGGDDLIHLKAVNGQSGQDVVVFQLGDGRDSIWGSGYTLRFGPGIKLSDLMPYGFDSGFAISGHADRVQASPARVEFHDGTVWDAARIQTFFMLGQPGAVGHFVGTQGYDELYGTGGDEVLSGLGGDDHITAGGGDDTVLGGAGDDLIAGMGGADELHGGQGDDLIRADAGDVVIYNQGDGRDTVSSSYGYELRLGAGILASDITVARVLLDVQTEGARELLNFTTGTPGDSIATDAPTRIVFDDGTVWGEAQWLARLNQGTSGNDTLIGDDAANLIQGLQGQDQLNGAGGNDTLDGGPGNDTLDGGAGRDTILFGRGDGNDVLVVSDNDTLLFKAGITPADVLFTRSLADNTLYAHITGTLNTVEIRPATQFQDFAVEFADGSRTSGADIRARAVNNERIDAYGASGQRYDGGAGDDWLTVKAPPSDRIGSAVQLAGGEGRDVLISGYRSYDTLEGGAGDDTLVSGSDTRLMDGGAGRDVYMFEGSWGNRYVTTVVLEGADELWGFNAWWDESSRDLSMAHLEHIVRLGDNDAILMFKDPSMYFETQIILRNADQLGQATLRFRDGAGLSGSDMVAMLKPYLDIQASDRPNGTLANDSMTGGVGNDTFYGSQGDDTMTGGLGADTYIYPGAGHDVLNIDSADSIVMSETGGPRLLSDVILRPRDPARPDDLVVTFLGSTDSVTVINARQFANVGVQFGDQSVTLGELLSRRDGPANQLLNGTSGHDSLAGGMGNDTLKGGAGNDVLNGLRGDDRIEGGLGRDTMAGGLGNDTLVGDRGNDTYLFARGDGQDTIIDKDGTWFNSDELMISDANSRQLWLTREGSDLLISVIGTQDSVRIDDWYASWTNRVENITAGDGKTLTSGRVNALVSAMAAFSPPAMGETTLPANVDSALSKVLSSSWR